MPVVAVGVFGEDWLVLDEIGFPVDEGHGVEIHVRPGVIAEWEAGIAPLFEHGSGGGLALELNAIHEAVNWGHVRVFHGGDEFAADFYSGFAGGESAVCREVVPSDGDLLGGCGGDCGEDDQDCEDDALRARVLHGSIIYRCRQENPPGLRIETWGTQVCGGAVEKQLQVLHSAYPMDTWCPWAPKPLRSG